MSSLFFAPAPPDLPDIDDEDEIEEERRRLLAIHSGGSVLGAVTPPSTVLGSATQLTGGL